MQVANGVLIGASHFPKSRSLKAIPKAAVSVKTVERIIKENSVMGLSTESTTTLIDYQDNTLIKEQVFAAASKKADAFFFYYSGNIVLRKDQLYIATPESSHEMIYANGIAFHELLAILQDSQAQYKLILLDAQFIDGDQELSEVDKHQAEKLLADFAQSIQGCALISSTPGIPFHVFNGGYESTLLTTAFVHCLKLGSKIEKPELVLKDLVTALCELMVSNGEQPPYLAGEYDNPDLYILPNFRYLEFETYQKNADQLFESDKFSEAYIAYNHCLMLFPNNERVLQKVNFIKNYIEGETKYEKQDFAAAYAAFSNANQLINNPKAYQNAVSALEKWALQNFETGKFEVAKAKYELLIQLTSDAPRYEAKIKEVESELAFAAAIDQADKYYYDNQYQKAAIEYDKALKIRYDVRVSRRKSECDTLVEKEVHIKEQIESEIREQVSKKFESEFEAEFSQKKQQIIDREIASIQAKLDEQIAKNQKEKELLQKEFETEKSNALHQATQEVEARWQTKLEQLGHEHMQEIQNMQTRFDEKWSELEQKFWSALSLWNHIDGYRFYLDFFKDGKYIPKAQKRVAELERETQSQVLDEQTQTSQYIQPLSEEDRLTPQENIHITEAQVPEELSVDDQITPTDSGLANQSVATEQLQVQQEPSQSDTSTKELRFEVIERPKRRVIAPEPEPQEVNMTEQELWEYAVNGATVESYMFYIENSKEKKYIADAYYQINQIKKGQVPVIETDASTLTPDFEPPTISYPTFTQDESAFTQKETDQEEESLWLKASSENTISAYYAYINNSKSKTYWNEAKEKIAQLKLNSKAEEQADWELAEKLGTAEAYQDYIRKYPLGNYYAQAMFKINKLQS